MAIDLENAKLSKFEGMTHAELREAGDMLGVHFGPNSEMSFMRNRLCEKLGEAAAPPPPPAPPETPTDGEKPAPIRMVRMQRPRLAPGDKWEGRCRFVKVNTGEDTKGKKGFILYWNAFPKVFPYNQWINLPEPYWNILSTAKVPSFDQEPVLNSRGHLESMELIVTFTPRFSYTDGGWSKGTENLPGSILEYWQREAQAKEYFRPLLEDNKGRSTLISIRADLMGSVGRTYFKDLTNEDIWLDIMQFLGFEDMIYAEVA